LLLQADRNSNSTEAAAVWDVCRSGLGLYLVGQALTAMGSHLEAVSEVRQQQYRRQL
jgi:hypothetical protein